MKMISILAVLLFGQIAVSAELPKVVLVGDSIRLSYATIVAKQLSGQAEVISAKANGGDSRRVLQGLQEWAIRPQPDVVCFNCGIHDTKKFTASGSFQVGPQDYEKNLRQIVKRIRESTQATVIFITTTPVLDAAAAAARRGRDYQLLHSSVQQYNGIAIRVMRELDVPMIDLYDRFNSGHPALDTLHGNDGLHLTAAGQQLAAEMISAGVRKELRKRTAATDEP